MATSLCHRNGILEYWNVGILRERAEINPFNCKKTPSDPLFHYSIIFTLPACPACPVAPAGGTGVGPH